MKSGTQNPARFQAGPFPGGVFAKLQAEVGGPAQVSGGLAPPLPAGRVAGETSASSSIKWERYSCLEGLLQGQQERSVPGPLLCAWQTGGYDYKTRRMHGPPSEGPGFPNYEQQQQKTLSL